MRVKPHTEIGQETEDSQWTLGLESETLPVERCEAQGQERQRGLQLTHFFCPDWRIFSPGGEVGKVGHPAPLVVDQSTISIRTDSTD